MRGAFVAIIFGVAFVFCCGFSAFCPRAFGGELAELEPVPSDAVTYDVPSSVPKSAPALAASSTTLDTVNDNVLALRNLFGDTQFWWNKWPISSDTGETFNPDIALRQWFMLDKITRTQDGNTYDLTTPLGHVKHIDALVTDGYATVNSISLNVVNMLDDIGDIKMAVTSGNSGTVSLDAAQWATISDTIRFQNFALLVLTVLTSSSIGCSLWGAFSKGWRK